MLVCRKTPISFPFPSFPTLIIAGQNIDSLTRKMNGDLIAVDEGCYANSLALNAKKCEFMLFNEKTTQYKTNLKIYIQNNEINRVTEFKLIGIFVDKKLTWKRHTNYISSKISQGLYGMSRVKHYVSKETLTKIFFALVHSHLTYCNAIWGNTFDKYLNKTRVLQKKSYSHYP